MKINDYSATLDEKLSEFDMWITPSLGEIRDTPQFKVNLELLKKGFDYGPMCKQLLMIFNGLLTRALLSQNKGEHL